MFVYFFLQYMVNKDEYIIAILQSVSERQRDKVNRSRKNADFSTLMVAMATSLEKSEKAQ